MNRRAMHKLFLAALFAVSLTGCTPNRTETLAGTDLTGSAISGAFSLIDKNGKPVNSVQFNGKYRIVYFGYAFCPDVCPVDVAVLMRGFERFAKDNPARAAKIQPIFITVDPERDTPSVVGEFAANFSPQLLGLTGSRAQIDAAIKAFRVYAVKGQQSAGGYLMDHSRHAYLLGPDGKPIEVLPVDKGAKAVARDLDIAVR
jgi:protein SCO1/2